MKSAFTIIELLVVIVVIAILASLAFPIYGRVAERGRAAACIFNLSQLGIAVNLYLGEHNATMPNLVAARTSTSQNVPAIDNSLNAYTSGTAVFACPSDTQGLAAATGTSYYWNSALDNQPVANLKFMTVGVLANIPVLSDKEGFHPYTQNKVNILYGDGHATQNIQFTIGQ